MNILELSPELEEAFSSVVQDIIDGWDKNGVGPLSYRSLANSSIFAFRSSKSPEVLKEELRNAVNHPEWPYYFGANFGTSL